MLLYSYQMNMVKNLKEKLQAEISAILEDFGIDLPMVTLERTSNAGFGEFTTNVAMRYAKELKKSPLEIAEQIAEKLEGKELPEVMSVDFVAPGFINLRLSREFIQAHIKSIVDEPQTYGRVSELVGQKWVIEHTSPNPNKAMHLGHLRNNLVGMSLVRLLKNAGAEVVSDCVYNDRGIAIAKMMYGFLVHMRKSAETPAEISHFASLPTDWKTPADLEMKPDEFVSECYIRAEEDFKNNEEVEKQVRQMVVDWEAKDENTWKLWSHVLQYAYDGNSRILDRLGSYWDKVWYEHEHYEKGKEYVQKGLDAGIFQKLEDGAVLTNLEEKYSLPDTILLKKDGTSLYITQDIALTDIKKNFYGADKLVWVVGPEQSLSFKQLFAVCEQLEIGKVEDFSHVTYGYVGLKAEDGGFKKMSSRAGTVVLIDDVIDTAKESILARFKEDGKTGMQETAEKLAIAAVKFSFLRSDRNQEMTFDIKQSIDVQGDSGVYVMYSYVRTQSILRKAEEQGLYPELTDLEEGEESSLVRSLLYFNEVIAKSADDLSVHHVSQYLLDICAEFNRWYAKEIIIDDSSRTPYRLLVTAAVGNCLKNGLELLGVEVVQEI